MEIRIICDQTDCIHNSEYTIDNNHECCCKSFNIHINNYLDGSSKVRCDSKEVNTTLTTHDLLEIDESKEIGKEVIMVDHMLARRRDIPWPCSFCKEDREYCINTCSVGQTLM